MGWGRRNDGWGGWPRYVPVAERREKARKQAEKLSKKKGATLSPVTVSGRAIASSFWGKAWCQNLEKYSDYANRIPRGRTYVRNGSVIDLHIAPGQVNAQVSGTHLYSIKIAFKPLRPDIWLKIKRECTGKIGSLIELLQGKLSKEVMEIVTRERTGLFPEPSEISFNCSCPDVASLCKHVAATLYGIGARLDQEPELLFLLRGVDHLELIAAPDAAAGLAASPDLQERKIAEEELSAIFGIEIDGAPSIDATDLTPTPLPPREISDTAKQPLKPEFPKAPLQTPTRRRGRKPSTRQANTVIAPKEKSPEEKPPISRKQKAKPEPKNPRPTIPSPVLHRPVRQSAVTVSQPDAQPVSASKPDARPVAQPVSASKPDARRVIRPVFAGKEGFVDEPVVVKKAKNQTKKPVGEPAEDKFKRRKAFIEAARKMMERK